jgi:hypothetical protein
MSGPGIVAGSSAVIGVNEDSNASGGKDDIGKVSDWGFYEDIFHEGDEDMLNSDSDCDYDESYTRSPCYENFFSFVSDGDTNKCLYLAITFQSSLTFAGNTRSLPKKEGSERSSNSVCSGLTLKF